MKVILGVVVGIVIVLGAVGLAIGSGFVQLPATRRKRTYRHRRSCSRCPHKRLIRRIWW